MPMTTTKPYRILQLDVFADRLFEGNPLAVVLDADDLDSATMQRLARWTNLSETAFLLTPTQPTADYRVRIFTPRQELPFAGHPSVGSAYAAIERGRVASGKTALVQECAAGLLPVRVVGEGATRIIHVQAPPAHVEACSAAMIKNVATALGVAPDDDRPYQQVNNGPLWIVCDLAEASAVRSLAPDFTTLAALCEPLHAVGVCAFGREEDGTAAMAVRAFCPADGIPEDPVTGSANAAIAAYLHATGGLGVYGKQYRASQGREVGRNGFVDVSVDLAGPTIKISIGGACVIGITGELQLPAIG